MKVRIKIREQIVLFERKTLIANVPNETFFATLDHSMYRLDDEDIRYFNCGQYITNNIRVLMVGRYRDNPITLYSSVPLILDNNTGNYPNIPFKLYGLVIEIVEVDN